MDYDKLAKELGGSAYGQTTDLDKLAKDLGGSFIKLPTPEEQEALNTSFDPFTGAQITNTSNAPITGTIPGSDTAKLIAAGAAPLVGAPEGIEAALQNKAAGTTFMPMDVINQLANPQNIANKIMSGELFIPKKVQQNLESRGVALPQPFNAPEKDLIQLDRAKASLDETLSKGKIPQFKDLSLWGEKTSKALMDDLSPEMKDAMAMSTPTGDLVKALDTFDFSGISAGKDPSALGYYGQAVKVFGSAAPLIIGTVITKNPSVGGALGFGQASSEAVGDAREYIEKMSFDELTKKSEYFRNLIALGYEPELAKQMTQDKAGNTAAEYQGIVGALGGEFTGNLLTGKFAGKIPAIKNKILRGLGAGTTSVLEEGSQEYFEGIATDLGIDKTVVREMGADSFANFLLGALGGFGPGVVGGVRESAQAKPTEKPVTKQEPSTITPVIVQPTLDQIMEYGQAVGSKQDAEKAQSNGDLVYAFHEQDLENPILIKDIDQMKGYTADQLLVVPKNKVEAAAPKEEAPEQKKSVKNLFEDLKQDYQRFNQKLDNLRKRKAPELVETPPIEPITVAALEEDQFEEPVEQPEFKAPEVATPPKVFQPEEVKAHIKEAESGLEREKLRKEFEDQNTVKNEFIGDMPETKQDIKPMDMGENTEYRVFQTDKGWTAGLFDKDANQLVTSTTWPFSKFPGQISKQSAIAFADEQAKKAAPYIAPKTQAEINQERQAAQKAKTQEKELQGVDAAAVSLGDFQNGILMGMNGENAKSGLISDDALKLLKANELVTEAANGKMALLPKGNNLLNVIRQNSGVGKEQTAEQRKEMFAKFIPQIAEAPKAEVKEEKPAEKPRDTGTEMYPFAKPEEEAKKEVKVSENKVFTEDAAEKARALLKSKLNQLNSGIDPEVLQAGIILSGYHVEKGARTFAAYSAAMIKDLGDAVKPYLKSWYMALKYDPRSEDFKNDMDSADVVDKFEYETKGEFPDLMTPEGKFEVAKRVTDALLNGASYENIAAARQFIKGIIGRTINPGTAEAKEADEAIEVGVVMAARSIVDERNSPEETYNKLVDLYNRQPSLNVRTSTSIKEQAYSTPAPLAYIASQLAGIDKKTTVYEPTAGNGMLLIGADPKNVKANELNATRYEMLKRVMPDAEVVNKNALNYSPELSDVIIANPPFGAIGEELTVGGIKTREIDHAIAYQALSRMPVNGRAVLIVGGVRGDTEEARKEGYRSAQKRNFYFNLYQNYNVVDHFTVSGDLYKKQGAAYPVDVIVINGKGQSERNLPAADLPKVYDSYEQLKEKLDEASRMESRGAISATGVDRGNGEARSDNLRGVAGSTIGQGVGVGEKGERSTEVLPKGMQGTRSSTATGSESARGKPSEAQPSATNISERGNTGQESVAKGSERVGQKSGENVSRGEPERLGGPSLVSGTRVEQTLKDRRGQEQETANQVTYNPFSEANSVGTVVPVNMRDAIEKALKDLQDKVGNLDNYVAKALKMDKDDVLDYFSAEQVDALALAINNAEMGKGFIIGDQTGVGKGRVVAGMVKYALAKGKIPIFVTEKANLYADLIRDMDDIDMARELGLDTAKPKVLITNTGEKIDYQIYRNDKDGNLQEINLSLKSLPGTVEKVESVMKDMMKNNSLGDYKVVFTNYSQVQTQKGKLPLRAEFLKQFGADNFMIFDESHNAGGSSATTKNDSDAKTRSKFIRELVNNAFGTFFSSATYAKNPSVMDLYSSTDMRLAVDNISELGDAIRYGGVPMQQIVATMLTNAGQYIRRERTFAGVSYDTVETKVDKTTAENMAFTMREILDFSRGKQRLVKGMQKEFDKEAKRAGEDSFKTEIKSTGFGSRMHALIGQMLLSLKAKDTVKFAIEQLKKDEKVVITVANTMGSFLKDFATDADLKVGDEFNISFADLFLKYLDKQREVTITGPEGKVKHYLTDEELGPALLDRYKEIKNYIQKAGFSESPVSPIDYIRTELKNAGYTTDEITGRTQYLDYAGGTPVLKSRNPNMAQRLTAIRGFNNGKIDVLILNQAGSTGISLHSNAKFEDKRKRHMIIAQAEANIDTHMQMLGRVHRTGQVTPPAYSQLMADIPAEMRPAAVLMKKMASLNANTTASRKSAVTAEGVVDFMNEYGGQVVMEYLKDNPEVVETLGGDDFMKVVDDSTEADEEDIRKFTGYIPVLPIKQQEEIYNDLIERYNELIDRENSLGTNKLEAKEINLQAETLSTQPITEDKGEASIFARPANMEKVEVNRTVKPYSKAEVEDLVKKSLDGSEPAKKAGEMRNDVQERMRAFAQKVLEKLKTEEVDPVKLEDTKNKLNAMYSNIKTILETYRVGDQVSIKDPNGVYNYAVITDVTNSKKTANPCAGSDWKMQLALANGEARAITINFSQINNRYTLNHENYYVDWFDPEKQEAERIKVIDIFDKGSTVRREKRWMVTGNILAGFAQYPGQIVSYTKKDGTLGQGVLMSRQFDFEKAQKEAPVRIKSGDQAIQFFNEIGGVLAVDDNNLRIERSGRTYYFFTPKTKRQGGKYFQDEKLTNLVGTFYSSGGNMRAAVYDESKARDAIQYLLDEENKIVVKTGVEKARAMFAPPKLENIEEKQLSEMAVEQRKESIKEFAKVRKSGRRLVKQIAKYGTDIPMQRQLNELLAHEENLKSYIDSTKPLGMTAKDFMARATDALKKNEITPDVERFIRSVYEKYPNILNGIKLSVRAKKGGGSATGNFDPISRLVTLWKGTSGVLESKTVRHELTHTMEQMMTPEQRKAVIGAWARSLEAAMKKYKDKNSQAYFDAVLKFLEDPTVETAKAATDIMPDYSYYQYLNPSEYWAVNAEKLFGQQLGGAWTRFVKAMEKMFEALKAMFFMNNKLAVHRAFDQIIKKQPTRETRTALIDYLSAAKVPTKLLNQIEEDQNLIDELGIPDVPDHEKQSFKDYAVNTWNQVKDIAARTKADPKKNMGDAIEQGYDAVTKQRIENAWFGAGLDKRDMERWGGQIRTDNGRMVPSVAVKNDLRSAYIANAVIVHGGLEYSGKYGQFIATDREQSMGNVIRLQHTLRQRLTKKVADKLINGWFAAMRTRSIQEEFFERSKEVQKLQEAFMSANPSKKEEIALLLQEAQRDLNNITIAYQKAPFYLCKLNEKKPFVEKNGERIPNVEYNQDGLPILDDEAIDALISRSEAHPELQAMMDNWTAVNHNMLDNMAFSGRISKPLAEKLKKIKNYSPWYRIMDEQEDIYDANKMQANAAGVRHFKAGRTERDIDNVVESMLHNVSIMTRSAIRNYAYNRIATEYGERRPSKIDPQTGKEIKGRLRVYPNTGIDENGVRVPLFNGGRRVIINIPDKLVGDAYLGMAIAPWEFPLKEVLAQAAQLSRRTITFSLIFQVRQVFYDAPTAALISGSKKPFRLWGSALYGFYRSLELTKQDPTVQLLRRAGIGGFRSHHRTAKKELALELGILTKDNWLTLMSAIDKVGDASDLSQRVAVKDRILKESGDPALALLMSSEVMDFGKHGKSNLAAFFRSTVTFMQAWATQLDALTQAAIGGTLKGKSKEEARKQFRNTMLQFIVLAGAYTLMCLGDDDYDELDDQTKARNLYVPGSKKATGQHVLIPLHSTAAYFFKVIPELLINSFMKYNTDKEIDRTRFMTALYEGFVDSVLGPAPIPSGIKPSLEIFFDRNTYTGGTVVPKSLADVEPAQQYTAATSELSKRFGEYTGISPVKMDHFIRGTFGTAGAMAQWFSNMLFSEGRVAPQVREMPVIGGFVAPDVLKLNEQLYYDLKERSAKKYETWMDLLNTDKFDAAEKYYDKNEKLIEVYGYVSSMEQELKDINKQIREIGRRDDRTMTPAEKREAVNDLNRQKQEMLDTIIEIRKDAGL